ncbi:TetR/AcrR family transcriptional regulator [Kocuria palustris]|uniref:TetR/AcrR family transcriptional regulator n=1 Tax=Kocuria palustris TaxID=71999 RepID=UPI00119D53FD|nr:TetR/AcrR family transcriptional regulator [Kocuria palustris]
MDDEDQAGAVRTAGARGAGTGARAPVRTTAGAAAGPSASSSGRQWRQRARTEARLLDAARRLVAERGLDAVTMSEAASEAGVAAGTVYNYFPTVQALIQRLVEREIDSVGRRLDRVAEVTDDPAEIYAGSLRLLVRHALGDPLWGQMYVRLGVAHPAVVEILGPRARRDIQRGMDTGRLQVIDLDMAVVSTFGSLSSAIHLVTSGRAREELADHFAEGMLRMVGLTCEQAHEVVSRPLPTGEAFEAQA